MRRSGDRGAAAAIARCVPTLRHSARAPLARRPGGGGGLIAAPGGGGESRWACASRAAREQRRAAWRRARGWVGGSVGHVRALRSVGGGGKRRSPSQRGVARRGPVLRQAFLRAWRRHWRSEGRLLTQSRSCVPACALRAHMRCVARLQSEVLPMGERAVPAAQPAPNSTGRSRGRQLLPRYERHRPQLHARPRHRHQQPADGGADDAEDLRIP